MLLSVPPSETLEKLGPRTGAFPSGGRFAL